MYQPISLTFSSKQRQRIQELMNYYRLEKEFRNRNANDLFKETLMSYLASVKGQQEIIQQLKKLLKQKKIQIESKEKFIDSNYEMLKSLRQLRKYIKQKQNDSDCYTFYISFMNQLKDMKPQNLSTFQSSLSKITMLNVYERQNIRWATRKIIKQSQNQQRIENDEAVSSFMTQILRYGFSRQIRSLQLIKDKNLLQKCQALITKIQNNYIEIQSSYENPFKQFMQKIVLEYYHHSDLERIISKMSYKLQKIVQPLLQYVLKLRQAAGQKMRPTYTREPLYPNYQIKKAQQESIEQLISDFSAANKKNDKLQAEINLLRRFIISVSKLSSISIENQANKEIAQYIQKCEGQELRYSLLKIYQKFNNYGYKEPAHKTFRESRENELLCDKLNKKIAQLDKENAKYREEIRQLDQQRTENLDQRIQLLKSIEQYTEQVQEKNIQISKLQKSIQVIQKLKEQKIQLENVIRILQERDKQKSAHLTNQNNQNKEYKQTIDRLFREKQGLIEQTTNFSRQLQSLKQQLKQKTQQDITTSLTQISRQTFEKQRQVQVQLTELQKQNSAIKIKVSQLKLENQQLNMKLLEMQELQKVVEQLNNRNDILSEKLEIFIKTKEIASERGSFKERREQNLLAQIEMLKGQIEILTKNEFQTREREQQCERELDNLKELFKELMQQQEKKEKTIIQLQTQNENLKKEIIQIRETTQVRSFRIQQQSSRQNKILLNELEQARKLNELIKTQYINFKEQSKNVYKTKLEEENLKYQENQEKLRDNYRKLHELFLAQKEKMTVLKSENQKLIKERTDPTYNQTISLKYLTQKSQLQEKYKDLVQKNQSLKTFSQRQLIKKQQQIANLKLQLIRSERNNQKDSDMHQRQIIQQKLDYLEGEVYELNERNSHLRVQLERREQQILILKTRALK